jgi:anti-sigma factor (TIGR02949 family)
MSFLDKLRSLFTGIARDGGASPSAMTPCEEALSVVHDFLDGELVGVSHEQVKAHFDACQRCYPHLRLEEHYRQAVRRAGSEQQAPAGLKVKLMELLAEADA